MMDRVAANPGRMRITPESGDPAFYATLEMADNPSVDGTPLNKASLLQDTTAGALGLDGTATVNDAFVGVLKKLGLTPVFLTVTVAGKTAKAGIRINGVTNADGSQLTTDGKTDTYLCFSATTSVSASVSGYMDLANKSISGTAPSVGILRLTLALSAPTGQTKKYTSSASGIKFSPYVSKIDICCIGGGGGGGGARGRNNSTTYSAGGGGGGGRLVNQHDVPISANQEYAVVVGAGGSGGQTSGGVPTDGVAGGASMVRIPNSTILAQADGGGKGVRGDYYETNGASLMGTGGAGNGAGGPGGANGSPQTDGSVFGSSSNGSAGGGGGGGNGSGGSPYGGNGGNRNSSEAEAGKGDGGGGGGGYHLSPATESTLYSGAKGHSGAVYLRWEVDLA